MTHGDQSHAPRPFSEKQAIAPNVHKPNVHDVEDFVRIMRLKRNIHESNLKSCESPRVRERLMMKIEQYNIMIQEFGYEPYGKKRKSKF